MITPELVFATNNDHKVAEIQAAIGDQLKIVTLKQAGITIDIPEPHDTLEDNAREKSRTIFRLTGKSCFGEDTGLEVDALNGEPGVKSARYAATESPSGDAVEIQEKDKTFDKNIDKLLQKLEGQDNRRARFRTVISLVLDGQEHLFEGICNGTIIQERRGTNGFGYDPVFVPDGSDRTFAEMTMAEKGKYSHRRRASEQLILFLEQIA